MSLPTVILPGFFASADEYQGLETALNQLGCPTLTVPLRKRDWIPGFAGPSIAPILRQLNRTVQEALQQFNAQKINLIGHSAGGWISRIYLGEVPYNLYKDIDPSEKLWSGKSQVKNLVTLGTPHFSAERWTRKNLAFVNQNYPGAFYPDVRYICIAGKAIYGQRRPGQWLAHNSYQQTCGIGNTWGDGITPIKAAHLEGAENLILEGVRHSPRSGGEWYGSPTPLQAWLGYLE